MRSTSAGAAVSPFKQPKAVFAVAIHVPFFIGAAVVAVGIAVLSTAHGLLGEAERVQAEQVGGAPRPTETAPVTMVPVEGGATGSRNGSSGVILAAIDGSPLWRHARSNIVIVNPAAPVAPWPRPEAAAGVLEDH